VIQLPAARWGRRGAPPAAAASRKYAAGRYPGDGRDEAAGSGCFALAPSLAATRRRPGRQSQPGFYGSRHAILRQGRLFVSGILWDV